MIFKMHSLIILQPGPKQITARRCNHDRAQNERYSIQDTMLEECSHHVSAIQEIVPIIPPRKKQPYFNISYSVTMSTPRYAINQSTNKKDTHHSNRPPQPNYNCPLPPYAPTKPHHHRCLLILLLLMLPWSPSKMEYERDKQNTMYKTRYAV